MAAGRPSLAAGLTGAKGDGVDAFAGYQNEIYMAGLQDALPELPTDLTRLEALAAERLPPTSFGQ